MSTIEQARAAGLYDIKCHGPHTTGTGPLCKHASKAPGCEGLLVMPATIRKQHFAGRRNALPDICGPNTLPNC